MISGFCRKNGLLVIPKVIRSIDRRLRSAITTFSLKRRAIAFGARSVVQDRVLIENPSRISVGNECLICSRVELSTECESGVLFLGSRVQINKGTFVDYTGDLLIGDGVLISEGVLVYTHDHGLDPRSRPVPVAKKIGKNAWIGARAIILPGCSFIGYNAVIGAGSVVTSDVMPDSIYAGNPARFIRKIQAE